MEKLVLERYINQLKNVNILVLDNNLSGYYNTKIYGVSCNSNNVVKDSIFICKGNNFNERYLDDAITKGAIFYLSEKDYNKKIPCILVKDIRKAMAIVTNIFYENARDTLDIVGITGTKGKSTTAYYIKYILDEYLKENLKRKCGIISSIKTYDGKNDEYSMLTTPESIELNERFYNMKESSIKNVVMEVSSQALKYDRTFGIKFKVGVFLNISEDHISPVEHSDFEDYFNSKLQIFKQTEIACVNLDSDYSDRILKEANKHCKKVITFSMKNKDADVYATNIEKSGLGIKFNVKSNDFNREFILNMPGIFNVENALAAISVAIALKIDSRFIYSGLKIAKTEGRMEIFKSDISSKLVIVDYAHNKLSFEKVFESAKEEYPNRQIVCVFGCPGNKAVNRRVELPSVASKYSTKIYLTSDDPGTENPQDICKEIAKNIKTDYETIIDRKKAIEMAIKTSPEDSIVLVLGKGSEKIQKMGDKKEEYLSDIYYAKKYINEVAKKVD